MSDARFELDADTALLEIGPGRYRGEITDRWTVAAGPNGCYVAALMLRGVLIESTLPDPLTMTVHYLSRPAVGYCEVQVETLRIGRGHTTLECRLLQDGEIRAVGLVTLGRLREAGAHDFSPARREMALPPEDATVLREREMPAPLWDRLDLRVGSPEDVFFLRSEPGSPETGGWTRLADGRPTDALCVPLFLDCWPPAVFSRTMSPSLTGAPTIELTVHWRNRVGPQWHFTHFETRLVAGGYMDESGELWSADGRLVAESRQLARW